MRTNQHLIDFYNHYDEDSRLAMKHGSVEFLTTMHYIEKYIKPGDHVLEVGAGTGRYSHALARQGYEVDAIELVEHNIDIFRQNTKPDETITITQGTKPGGVVFAAYVISDGCLLDEGFHRGNINVAEYIRKGLLDAETFAAKSEPKDLFELVRKENVDELMSIFPVTRLHYVATDGCALLMREALDAMDDDTFEWYLRYHFTTCEREDLIGVTSHAVDVFRKNVRNINGL